LKLVKETNIPIILVNDDTFTTAQKITNLIIKIRPNDTEKISKIKKIFKEYVDIEFIVNKL